MPHIKKGHIGKGRCKKTQEDEDTIRNSEKTKIRNIFAEPSGYSSTESSALLSSTKSFNTAYTTKSHFSFASTLGQEQLPRTVRRGLSNTTGVGSSFVVVHCALQYTLPLDRETFARTMSRLIEENPNVDTIQEAIEITVKHIPEHLQFSSEYTILFWCRTCNITTHFDRKATTMPLHFPENAKGAQHIQALLTHRQIENDDTIPLCSACHSHLSTCYSSRPPNPYIIFELYPYVTGGKEMRTDLIYNGRSFWWNSAHMSVTCFLVATCLISEEHQQALFGRTYVPQGHFVAVVPRGRTLLIVDDDNPVRVCPLKNRKALLGGITHICACEILTKNVTQAKKKQKINRTKNSAQLKPTRLNPPIDEESLKEKIRLYIDKIFDERLGKQPVCNPPCKETITEPAALPDEQ